MDSLNLSICNFMKIRNMHMILLQLRCMNKHENMCFDLVSVNSETLAFVRFYFSLSYFVLFQKNQINFRD